MSEFRPDTEPISRKARLQAHAAHTAIEGLSNPSRFTNVPGEIGSVIHYGFTSHGEWDWELIDEPI